MNSPPAAPLQPPRFEEGAPLLLAGLARRHASDAGPRDIPGQWDRFAQEPHVDTGRVGDAYYGVCWNAKDGSFDYLCAFAVADTSRLPDGWTSLRIPARRYAVFTHREHISAIRHTWRAIWNEWVPTSGHTALDEPTFERYGPEFDGETGNGGVEIWIPIQS